jgi:hypothetical protein
MNRIHPGKPRPSALSAFEIERKTFPNTDISLHRLWRSVGSPREASPDTWLALACPLLEGFSNYQQMLCEVAYDNHPDDREGFCMAGEASLSPDCVAFPLTPEVVQNLASIGRPLPGEIGDTVAHHEIAFIYAMFLDKRGVASMFDGLDGWSTPLPEPPRPGDGNDETTGVAGPAVLKLPVH